MLCKFLMDCNALVFGKSNGDSSLFLFFSKKKNQHVFLRFVCEICCVKWKSLAAMLHECKLVFTKLLIEAGCNTLRSFP